MFRIQCKCGEMWRASIVYIPTKDCQGCTQCQTTFVQMQSNEEHKPLQQHTPKCRSTVIAGKEYASFDCAVCGDPCHEDGTDFPPPGPVQGPHPAKRVA